VSVPNNKDILMELRDQLEAWMSNAGYGNAVYLVEAPIDEVVGQFALQIIPGPDTASHPISGVGLIRTTFDIIVWWRNNLDSVGRGTQRIAGDEGVEGFTDELREWLVQRKLNGMLAIPIVFENGGILTAVDGLEGWLTIKDTYRYAYMMNWTVK
jgi:hypothetical protein